MCKTQIYTGKIAIQKSELKMPDIQVKEDVELCAGRKVFEEALKLQYQCILKFIIPKTLITLQKQ